ncbi:endo-alpha-N-acetylgalactosaminidase family protein [Streptomyces sp. NPDC050508]|uniref:endo-alpha-N-acetylgalactosaminidase family protein n=1 Tax=Streptomyces sp. NPDC050508 TaxID=3155405 RepID=UPI0034143925
MPETNLPEASRPVGPSRRAVVVTAAAAGLAGSLAVPGMALADDGSAAVLRSPELEVVVDTTFPQIVSYTDRESGAVIHGRAEPLTSLLVNGQAYTPQVTATVGADRVVYELTLAEGVLIGAEIAVDGWTVTFKVTSVTDTEALRVGTLEIPGHNLVSVRSDQDTATVMAARVGLNKAVTADTTIRVTASTPADAKPLGCAYVVAHTAELGVALENNSVYDTVSTAADTTWENGRFWRRARQLADGSVELGISCGQWTYRAAGAPDTEPLPFATVIITRDRNDDGIVDWQDAAIALRDIMVEPPGADGQHLRVASHISYNFASQATNPFLAALDQVKRISLATDGLRQFTLLKGYQAEGHDSSHPDYGGNYNQRAGGLTDLNSLLRAGKKWHSDFAVHVNATEAYPTARHFTDTLADPANPQWDWLDLSYRIDSRRDLTAGTIAARFAQLRAETDPALNTVYLDVFRESGWTSDRLQRELHAQGWMIATEWGHGLERSSLWSHWANETDYGADTSRGINSQLIRFLRHHQKDVFADKWPLLPTARLVAYEGWRGEVDWNAFYANIWTQNLPAKYLQAYPIKRWDEHQVTFFGPYATTVDDTTGSRRITTDGRVVHDGGAYLLPWEPRNAADPDRLYHYNPAGGTTTWRLPRKWPTAGRIWAYPLSDTGRGPAVELPVTDGTVTITADPAQPYVVHRTPAPTRSDPAFGEATPLRDPGFLSGSLGHWQVTGPASVVRNALGDRELVIGAGDAAALTTRLRRLPPGPYAASVQVEVGASAGEQRRAALELATADGVTAVNWTDTSTAVNYVNADSKHGTRAQRMFTYFTVPAGGGPVSLTLRAAAGDARIVFDNLRVVAAARPQAAGALVFEDFEHVPQGWGPFVEGPGTGTANDPRTHVARRHSTYTQRGWNGKAIDDVVDGEWSLKSRGERLGTVYRTLPHTVRFAPGHRYRVTFRYENDSAGQYAWTTAVDTPTTRQLSSTPVPAATEPTEFTYEFTAPDTGEAWVGLTKTGTSSTAEFTLDAFTVTELEGSE